MALVRCALCNQPLHVPEGAAFGVGTCISCHRESSIAAFPALVKNGAPKPPTLSVDPPAPGEAACYYSPNRRATKECSHCGVLISDIWAAQWGSETVCLKCLEHLRGQGKDERFESRRILWDNVALVLTLVPLTFVFWMFAFLTAPAALFIGLRHWNSPRSLVPRSRARLVVALLLAFAQVGGAVFVVLGLYYGWFNST